MNLVEFLQDLIIKDWKFWIDGDRLSYRAPKQESISEVLTQLKQQKSEIIQLLRQRPDIFNVHPLSHGQKALWFLWQLAPQSSAYNQVFSTRICSELNIINLRLAFEKLIERHSCLRSTFPKLDEEPIQQVHQELKVDFQQIDASTWSETELDSDVSHKSQYPFDLENGPVIRVRLFTCSQQKHILLLVIHHIVTDGWSLDIILQELARLYQAEQNGVGASLSSLEYSYSDYVRWQKKMLEGTKGEKLRNYWHQKLKGDLPVLNLPTDKLRPSIQTYNGASCHFRISCDLTQQLKQLAKESKATIYMTLLAAFQVLLYRYTGQEDILVGSPVAGRLQSEFKSIVGYLANPVVLRGDLSNNPSFENFLIQVRRNVLEALSHQDYPFPLLVEKLQPQRDPSYSPIFQTSFTLQQLQKSQDIQKLLVDEVETFVDWGGLKLAPFKIPQQEGQFDLSLEIVEGNSSLVGSFKYNTDLFNGSTIEHMANHFQNLLEAVVTNPQQKVGELPLLTGRERHQLLVEWNNTQTEYPEDKCIHSLFEEQAAKTPDAFAVVFEDRQLTYKELNQRANQLAHYLRVMGVKPEILVGICVERSIEMVVGLLGVLKAGGVYVPLDPSYPTERLEFMLQDAQPRVLLTQRRLVESLPEHTAQIVCLDSDWGAIANESRKNLVREAQADNLAYIIYTSGSTGQPKGVMNTHRGIGNRLSWMQEAYQLTTVERVLQKTPFSFDVSVWEFFWPLITGASLIVAKPGGHQDTTYLVKQIAQHKITTLHFVPSMLQVFLEEPNLKENCRSLKRVICSGEALPFELQQRFFTNLDCELHNLYGPTEAAIDVTSWQCQPTSNYRKVPIGRPISNTQIYILDRHLQPVPIGVPGELYIAGVGLARGYLNRPELTQQKFIPNPFSDEPGARLYKTGDEARYLPDGNIEFLGRLDNQVKIRGFRIELEEIENVLGSHPKIKETVVVAHEDVPGGKRLVAYVVVNQDSDNISTRLRSYLKQKLPDYMVPSAFITLETMPLTLNGKINRRALPAFNSDSRQLETDFVAPRTPTEELLTGIWAEVLGIEQVGVHDNFFDLGGHSLLATKVVSRVRETFSVELPVHRLFEFPTIVDLAKSLESARQVENQIQRLKIEPVSRSEKLPLSYAQQRLWFLSQLEGGSTAYNMPAAFSLSGCLNIAALKQAIAEILQRHEALQTTFETVDGSPIQVINSSFTELLLVVDLQNLPATEQFLAAKRLATQEAQQIFDLTKDPLLRMILLRLGKQKHILLLTMHHIISDGWSIGILLQELSALYSAHTNEKPSPLPELSLQYADFAYWQREWLKGEILEEQLKYWQQQLAQAPSLLELPTDRPRLPRQSFRGSSKSFQLDLELTQKLKALSRESGTTLFMTLLTAFAVLLARYSSQEDIVIGSPVANRNRGEIESLIGFFVNTLALRIPLQGDPVFQDLLTRVRQVALDAYAHQDVPFEQIVEALQPERNLSHNPLFQVMFVLQNAPMENLELAGLSSTLLERETVTAKFDLTLSMRETSSGLAGAWEYNTDLFNGSTIERMASHFQTLLAAIVENPQQKVSELPLLSEAERHQLLFEWNDTQTEYPHDKCIHQLFEEQVEKTPDAVAVVFEEQQLTYRELNQRANQLAHYLQTLGVKPEVLVGICVERSINMVVGLLGILKAGRAYLPLDPTYPTERLAYMLSDSQPMVLLTQQHLIESLPSEHTARIVCLDSDWSAIANESKKNLASKVTAENIAYVIYTSGSTGTPKGAMNTHRGIHNRLCWMQSEYQLNSSDRVIQKTPFSFDVSVWEFFWTLMTGATMVVAKPEGHKDSNYLVNLIAQQQITTIHFVPSMLQVFLQDSDLERCNSLKRVVCSGEALPFELTKRFFERLDCQLHNLYGPTEAAIDVTYWQCQPEGDLQVVPIGRPIANTQTYILDKHLQPVPIGVSGELHIAGVGLARGYFNRRQLTQQKFIPNPFSNEPGARLYKTGDKARYLPNGEIEFLGRLDRQVKIRGFRIELGEIESVLNSHAQVQQAVVVVREDNPGNKRLIAYVVSKKGSLSNSRLRENFQQRLPNYMVPSAFVMLDTLPLTPNGKVDRQALPVPDEEIIREGEYIQPRTLSEEIIVNIFADLLNVQKVGVGDNFFELGGHSLLATQLISRLRQAFEVELPIRTVFEFPTAAKLEPVLSQLRTSQQQLSLPPIELIARDEEEALPLSWAQERLWFLTELEEASATYNMPGAIRLSGNLNLEALQSALSEIARRHEVLRTSFVSVEGTPQQVINSEANLKLKVVDLQDEEATERETLVQQQAKSEAITPFDLETAPLIRCSLLQLDATESVLLLTMHHIISDGWSIGILLRELSVLYSAYAKKEPSPLPELAIQYADFAIWQRQHLSGQILQTQLDYWLKQLEGLPELLQLPTDRPRPAVQTYQGQSYQYAFNSELTQKIKALAQRSGTTLFMVLQAVLAVLLYRYNGQSDIAIGSPIANRSRQEIEPLIGFFVNTLVLRTRLEDNPNFEELLAQVRETTLAAYEHQNVPFEKVVEALQPERSLSHSPLFQVMLVLQNALMSELELSDVTLTLLERETVTAKFDITLSMEETEQGLKGEWEYNTDLFDGSTIERMASHFQNLLQAVVTNPQQKVSELPLLSEAERHKLLVEWNNTQTEYPHDKCIHQLFEEQVEKTPDAVAVVFQNQQLTYQELNQRANQLAHYLRTLGVKPEVLVGICVERSIKMIVGLLGILKAGGAYVPLDPSYPKERLAYMLSDAQPSVLLTQQSLVDSLPEHTSQMVCLDADWGVIVQESLVNPVSKAKADNLAYVIYTSGSTGQPKGVAIEHQGLCNLTTVQTKLFQPNFNSRIFQFASISFDASVWENFMALCSGATLCLGNKDSLLPGLALAQLLREQNITHITLPPTALTVLPTEELPDLQTIIVAGEASSSELIEQWTKDRHFFNAYGPTESTICASIAEYSEDRRKLTIGRPISNTQIYILDSHLQPVPVGVPGELHIGGAGLARGYLNRPELTEEKFIPNPFSNELGARLYKTGDKASCTPDGNIEYLGRFDHQVKIRGFRIELGEIESVLATYPEIREIVVVAREDIPGDKRLVAYVVSENDSLSVSQLRSYLRQKLPDYMLPSAFVTLKAMPLTPNGKIDRKALPAPELNRRETENEFVAPRTPTEELLVGIWMEVLGIEQVGIHDNFFDLGGHSLLVTKVISRVREAFSVELPLRSLFSSPTVADSAQLIETLLWISQESEEEGFDESETNREVFQL